VNYHDLAAQYPAIQAEALRRWRNGSQEPVILQDMPIALRVTADGLNVESSHGFSIPVRHFIRGLPHIRAGVLPESLTSGVYKATELTATHFTAGCLTMPITEIERIAKKLGV
jgi:hypothetical protein